MRYWLDTEFIEDGVTIDLISIGIVAEDGRELYCESSGANLTRASKWVQDNVLPHLTHQVQTRSQIREAIRKFVGDDPKPQFWGYYADYDWVALCQLFGTMLDLPKHWSKYCRDIKQWCDMLGNPELPSQDKNEHHALADARWNKSAWLFLASHTPRSAPPCSA